MGIQLIDPNEELRKYISGQANLPYPNNISSGPVSVPPEDLVMYADLEVILPGRSVIVDDSASQNQRREHIGFIVPKPNQLPEDNYGGMGTSWSNIGGLSGFMKNKDGANVHQDSFGSFQKAGDPSETFGITDISIKLNASFEPQVFINFTDIRGASLMEPGLNSPYAAFFHMPYPLFTLTIKGYYGQGISYKLHLIKFNSKFDAETGNFNISCEFIGFTFTYLADIPAIYADVGPDLMQHYHGVGGGKDPSLPWPEGSMTIGTYTANIADMAAKMDAYASDEGTLEYNDMYYTLGELQDIRARWKLIIDDLIKSGGDKVYTYKQEEESLTVSACMTSEDPTKKGYDINGNPFPASEIHPDLLDKVKCDAKTLQNANDAYRLLYKGITGHDQTTAPDLTGSEEGSNAFKSYAQSVYNDIKETSAINSIKLPDLTLILTTYQSPVADVGDRKNRVGCVQVVGKEYLKDLDNKIRKVEIMVNQLKKTKLEAENSIKLGTLVMPPTLENIFKLICNGVGGFNWALNNVSEQADKQHEEDSYLKDALLKNPTTGTDIKSDSEKVFAWPLVYKTKEDRVNKEVNTYRMKKQNVTRFEKVFPGAKITQDSYEYPEYTTDPFFWPEIGFIELLINTIIKKTRLLNLQWDPEDSEFTTDDEKYIPAALEETPGVTNPYKDLEDIELQIIPLMMLRTMLRLGHTNRFSICDTVDCKNITNLKTPTGNLFDARYISALKTYGPNPNAGHQNDALELQGLAEAEAMITGIVDNDETKEKLRELFTVLTGVRDVQENMDGTDALNKAWGLLEQAGYRMGTAGKDDSIYWFQGASSASADGGPSQGADGVVMAGTGAYSFYGTEGKTSGKEIRHNYGYYLPNVTEELSTDIFYDPCGQFNLDADNSVTCPGFFISDVSLYNINTSSATDEQNTSLTSASVIMNSYYYHSFGQAEYGQSNKLHVGPQGSLDYDHDKWIGWDFYSFWNSKDYFKKVFVSQETNQNEEGPNYIQPDQWVSLSVIYSDPTHSSPIGYEGETPTFSTVNEVPYTGGRGVTGSGGIIHAGMDSDRQVLLMEDALFIKNNDTSNNPNYNYETIAPYSTAADTLGYQKAKVGMGSNIVDKARASNLALGYLFINSTGKYMSVDPIKKLSKNYVGDNWNILRLFNQFGSYATIPTYIIIQIGSWLYRNNQTEDIIKWPNYFNAEGTVVKGVNRYKIPKKYERPQPNAKAYQAEGSEYVWFSIGSNDLNPGDDSKSSNFSTPGRQTYRGGKQIYLQNWHLTNKLHFISLPEHYGKSQGKVGYDNIQKVIQVLPEYIQDQFQEAFIQWALGEPVKENQVYQLEPSWPAMKETLLEETNVKPDPDTGLQLHGASGKCQVAADPKYHGMVQDETPVDVYIGTATRIMPVFPVNLLPKGRLFTSFCADNWGTEWGKSTNQWDGAMKGQGGGGYELQFNRGICPLYHEDAFLYGGKAGLNYWIPNEENKHGQQAITYTTRELKDEHLNWNETGYVVENFSKKPATYTQPLLFNGYTNWGLNNQKGTGKDNLPSNTTWALLPDGEITSVHDWNTAINYSSSKIKPTATGTIPSHSFPKTITEYALGMHKFYYVRKTCDTDDIIGFAARLLRADKCFGGDPSSVGSGVGCKWVKNNMVDGFPMAGNSVYRNIQYMNPLQNRWSGFDVDGDPKVTSLYAKAHFPTDIGSGKLKDESPIGSGIWNGWKKVGDRALQAAPTFYVPEHFWDVNTINDDSEKTIHNQLYVNLKTLMEKKVSVKNITWRSWMGQTGPADDVDKWNKVKDDGGHQRIATKKEYLTTYFGSLVTRLGEYVNTGGVSQQVTAKAKMEDVLNDNDIKLDAYLTIKNLHDKWLTTSSVEMKTNNLSYGQEDASKITWLFNQFSFVDRAYNWIGHKYIDPTPLLNLKKNPKISLYTMIYDLVSHNKFEFFPLPSNIEFESDDAYSKMFMPYLTVDGDAVSKNPRFYIMYMGGFSDSLDIDSPDYQFTNDGFDIDDECINCPPDFFGPLSTIADKGPLTAGALLVRGQAKSVGSGGYQPGVMFDAPVIIPAAGTWECYNPSEGNCDTRQQEVRAFKVAFGQENQNFFKSITVDQAEFQETQESLLLIDALAREESTSKDPRLKGQNLYNVYQKRSYSCSVDALGMMNILPLQYFQLEHVPMFHGAYIITNVEHTITPGDISTTFKGTRISQSVIPYVNSFLAQTSDYMTGIDGSSNYVYDPNSTTVLGGDVERIGVWMDKKVGSSSVKTLQGFGMNAIVFELNSGWPEGGYGEFERWKGAEWRWQPLRAEKDWKTHTPNAAYTLTKLQEACKLAYEANLRVTLMLYYVPNKSYVEPMVGGTGSDTSYNVKTDWYDWAGNGLDVPPTLPELVQKLNTYCGGVCVHAVEFDLEGHYRKTHWSTSTKQYISGPYPLGYSKDIKKKVLARNLVDKLRKQFKSKAQSTEIGVTPYVMTNWQNKDTSAVVGKSSGQQYWKDSSAPEFSAIVDYIAVQSYSHVKGLVDKRTKVNGKDNPNYSRIMKCNSHSDCLSYDKTTKTFIRNHGFFCQGGNDTTGGVYFGEPHPLTWYKTEKTCQSITYAWPNPQYQGGGDYGTATPSNHGYAGPGARARYSGKTVKSIAESGFNGGTKTGKEPYYICGAAGYDQKFNYHTITEALTASWNGCVQPIAGNSYKPKEIRYWSYMNVFGKRGLFADGSGPVADFIRDQAGKKKS